MATSTNHLVSKSKRWFSNKSLNKLSFNNRRRSTTKSSSSSSSTSASPVSSPMCPARDTPMRSSSSSGNKEEELRHVFRHFDGNGDGKISAIELRSYFGSIGEYMSNEEAQAVIKDFDTDGDDLIDFQDFLKMTRRDDNDHDLRNAFEMFELEQGCITPKSLHRMLVRLGDHSKTYDDCAAMIRVFDKDSNGMIDFKEFHQMMT